MPEAFAFHEQIGVSRIAERIRDLNTRCKEQLAAVSGVTVVTPSAELSAGITCFRVDGKAPPDVVQALDAKGIASVTPAYYDPPYTRLSPGLLTDERDVDEAVAAVASLTR